MAPRCTGTAVLAALIACASAPTALAQDGVLVAQLAQAQPDQTLPPLTDAPEGLRDDRAQPEPPAEPDPDPDPQARPGSGGSGELPATGAEPVVGVLAGIGLVAAGLGLRRTADDLLGT